MIKFPLEHKPSDQECYDCLIELLHPLGFKCPNCWSKERTPHKKDKKPLIVYRCKKCNSYYNIFTRKKLERTRLPLLSIIYCINRQILERLDLVKTKESYAQLRKETGFTVQTLKKTDKNIVPYVQQYFALQRTPILWEKMRDILLNTRFTKDFDMARSVVDEISSYPEFINLKKVLSKIEAWHENDGTLILEFKGDFKYKLHPKNSKKSKIKVEQILK